MNSDKFFSRDMNLLSAKLNNVVVGCVIYGNLCPGLTFQEALFKSSTVLSGQMPILVQFNEMFKGKNKILGGAKLNSQGLRYAQLVKKYNYL